MLSRRTEITAALSSGRNRRQIIMAFLVGPSRASALRLAHEALAGGADESDRLGKEDPHRVTQSDRLLVWAAFDLHPAQSGPGQLDRSAQRERGELLALSLGDRL